MPNMPKVMMFNSKGKLREFLTIISQSAEGLEDEVVISLHPKFGGEVGSVPMLDFSTSNGITGTVSGMDGSDAIEHDVSVRLSELYTFCDALGSDVISMWESDGDLYVGTYYDPEIKCYESECMIQHTEKPEDWMSRFSATTTFNMDQTEMACVIDAFYEYPSVDIMRKNGVVSFRVGDDSMSIATAMVRKLSSQEDIDFEINIPVGEFKLIAGTQMSGTLSVEYDAVNGMLRSSGDMCTTVIKTRPSRFKTSTSDGFENFLTIPTETIKYSLDHIQSMAPNSHSSDVTIKQSDPGVVEFSISEPGRFVVRVTAGGASVKDGEIKIPLGALMKMVKGNMCTALAIKRHNPDDGRLFICYANDVFLRKCVFSPKQ